MEISLNDWIAFTDKMTRLSKKAADQLKDYIRKNGGYANMEADDIIAYAMALVQKYGEGAAALSAVMYDAIAELSGVSVPPAEVAQTASIGDVARSILGAAKFSQDDEYIGSVAGRLVKQAGVDTTLNNAIRDGAEVAWIPHGDTCAFCIALASRGWQRASKNLLKNGHAEHIHQNCDCTYAVRYDPYTQVEGYDPGKYFMMYSFADGKTPNEKINSMRREFYAKNKEKINEQKRAAYAKRKEREASAATELNVN